MRVTKTAAYQAHPVPSHAYYPPEDPLEADITRQSSVYFDEEEPSSDERIFRCKNCKEVLLESDIEYHECEQ